jgi:hypothetical protein
MGPNGFLASSERTWPGWLFSVPASEPLDRLHHEAQRLLRNLPDADQVGRNLRSADQVEPGEQSPFELRITVHRPTIGVSPRLQEREIRTDWPEAAPFPSLNAI